MDVLKDAFYIVSACSFAWLGVLWLSREYIKRWIKKHFESQLDAARHENAKELERLKVQLDAQLEVARHENAKELQQLKSRFDIDLNRVEKIIDKEFEILPEAWNKLQDANLAVGVIVQYLRSYPPLDEYTSEALEEFLLNTILKGHHKEEIRQASRKADKYEEIIFAYELNNAQNKISEFSVFIRRNAIFIRAGLKSNFLEIENLLSEVLIDRQFASGLEGIKLWQGAFKTLRDQVQPRIAELEELLQSALHKGQVDLPGGEEK